jgi:YidC/Oxa1 family membrane protein insertase
MDKRTLLFVLAISLAFFGVNLYFTAKQQEAIHQWKLEQEAKKLQQEHQKTEAVLSKPDEPFVSKNSQPKADDVEKFYVLENDYQQLVFSNFGGALAEINLPFQSEKNNKSVVKEIEFDREMVQDHPYNAHFPAHRYSTAGDSEEHAQGALGGYYPLLRRDLIEKTTDKSVRINPKYYGLNIVSEYPEVAQLVYTVKEFTKTKIVFEAEQQYRRITKTYSIGEEMNGAPYVINLTVKVEGDSRGLWLSSGVPEAEWLSGALASALKYRITRNKKAEVEKMDLPQEDVTLSSIYPDWLCNSNGFLGIIMDPLSDIDSGLKAERISGVKVPTRLVEIDQQNDRFKADDLPGYMMMLPLKSGGGTFNFRIFAGPFEEDILKIVDKTFSNPETGYNPDYIACQTFHGWFAFISEPFAKFLFILMQFFHWLTNSWALSIVLLTVALRIMLYPLNAWSMKSMAKMQEIGPQIKVIQEKHKNDPKQAQMAIMQLYREKGVNPFSGCLPLLIQMPFLIGMFDLLRSTFELRGSSFIPGWIDDLTAPDVLFSWNYPIFFIGNQFHLLPILLGAVMFLQQRMMSPLPKDPKQWTDQQRQQRVMGSVMAVVFTLMFYNFPSGLNIYWLSSTLLGVLQQWYTQKKRKAAAVGSKEIEVQGEVIRPQRKKKK